MNTLLAILASLGPYGAWAAAHPAVVVAGAFVLLGLLDAGEGGLLARKGKKFDGDLFGIQTKVLRGEVLAAGVALFLSAQTNGPTSALFQLAVVGALAPRCYVLLGDIRDKFTALTGQKVPDIPLPAPVPAPVDKPPTA